MCEAQSLVAMPPEAVRDDEMLTIRRSDLSLLKKMRERQKAFMRVPQSMKLLHDCAVLEAIADEMLAHYAGEPSPSDDFDREFYRDLMARWCACCPDCYAPQGTPHAKDCRFETAAPSPGA